MHHICLGDATEAIQTRLSGLSLANAIDDQLIDKRLRGGARAVRSIHQR
jgi:hypothetical protein